MGSIKSTHRTPSPSSQSAQDRTMTQTSEERLQAVLQEVIDEVNRITALLVSYGDQLQSIHQRISALRNAISHRLQAQNGMEAEEYRAVLHQIRHDLNIQIGREVDLNDYDLDERNRLTRL